MNAKRITPAELADKEKPGNGWYIIDAAGNHPQTCALPNGTELSFTQELTPEVLEGIAAAGVPDEGLFIDCDHEGIKGGPSAAVGWVRELAVCNGDLAARIEWTPLGLPLIEGAIYKHFSTVYPGKESEMRSGTVRPQRLTGLTLTNRPNNKTGQPSITNTEHSNPSPGNPAGKEQTQDNDKTMNPKILAALGCPADASEEEVLATIKDLQDDKKAAEDAAKTSAENEAAAIVNSEEQAAGAKLTDDEKEEATEQIIANHEHGVKYTRLLCASKATREQQPGARKYPNKGKQPETKEEEPEVAILNEAKAMCAEAKKAGKSLLWGVAYAKARNAYAAAHPTK